MYSMIKFPNHWNIKRHNLGLIILLLTGIGCGEDGKYPMKVENIDKEEGKWGQEIGVIMLRVVDIPSL